MDRDFYSKSTRYWKRRRAKAASKAKAKIMQVVATAFANGEEPPSSLLDFVKNKTKVVPKIKRSPAKRAKHNFYRSRAWWEMSGTWFC
jgi:hypothetical protein